VIIVIMPFMAFRMLMGAFLLVGRREDVMVIRQAGG